MLINVVQNFDVALPKISSYIKSHQPWYMDSRAIVQVIGSRENESQIGGSSAEKTSKLMEEKIIAFEVLVPQM